VLINKEGIIIDKWTGYGKGVIKNKLEKAFNGTAPVENMRIKIN
jgi:hypothetical protein